MSALVPGVMGHGTHVAGASEAVEARRRRGHLGQLAAAWLSWAAGLHMSCASSYGGTAAG